MTTTRETGERLPRRRSVNSEGGELASHAGICRGAFQAEEQQVQRPWGGTVLGMFKRALGLGQSEGKGKGSERSELEEARVD